MAALTGNSIDSSYQGLLKTTDNGAVGGASKAITDGLGNDLPMEVSSTLIKFTDQVEGVHMLDFEAANDTGSQIAKGKVVYITGDNGTLPTIGLADNTSASTMPAVGITAEDIADGASGKVVLYGDTVDFNTTGVAAGTEFFVGTAGNVTTTKPTGTALIQKIAKVILEGAQGQVLVLGAGRTNDLPNLAQNQVWRGDSNGVAGEVSLVAGTNMTITQGANSITFDATGGGGSAGLVSNGANGMKSDASLTTNPALSTGTNSIVLGDNARDEGNDDAISIGLNARVREPGAICIGKNTEAYSDSIAIGNGAVAVYPGVSIGEDAKNFGNGNAVVIGKGNNTSYASNVINIGGETTLGSDNDDNIIVGSTVNVADGNAYRNIYIGNDIAATTNAVDDNVIIGHGATTNTGSGVTIVGTGASATANGAVALGKDVVAATADTVSVKALEVQTDSTPTAGGIIISDAGGTDRRINIDSDGNLQVGSNTVNKAFSVGRYAGVQSDFSCDTIQSSVLIPGGTFKAGDILQFNGMESGDSGTGWVYTAFWLSTDGTIGNGGVETCNLGQTQTSQALWKTSYQKTVYVHTTDGTGAATTIWPGGNPSDVYNSGPIGGGDAIETEAINWNNDLYLVSRICIDNAGTNYVNHGGVIRKIN